MSEHLDPSKWTCGSCGIIVGGNGIHRCDHEIEITKLKQSLAEQTAKVEKYEKALNTIAHKKVWERDECEQKTANQALSDVKENKQ